ncbi:hypothetical protein BGX26_000167 [Mortierella sp. AD094]|nr:hypothetical protein BGX26_000167 [Mortierella sp. AD094]
MKFSLSVVILALAASQAMAVVPIPVKECTKSVIVQPTDIDGCAAFGSRNNATFENMLKWNQKLRPDCANLDVGHPICVSITKGDCCLASPVDPGLPTTNTTIPTTSGGVVPTTAPAANGTTTTTAGTVSTTKGANTTTTLPTSALPSPTNATTPATGNKTNDATGLKNSMVLAAAGVMLSVAYML